MNKFPRPCCSCGKVIVRHSGNAVPCENCHCHWDSFYGSSGGAFMSRKEADYLADLLKLVEVNQVDIAESERNNIYFNPVANAIRRVMHAHVWIDDYLAANVVQVGYFWIDRETKRKLIDYDKGNEFTLPHDIILLHYPVFIRVCVEGLRGSRNAEAAPWDERRRLLEDAQA